MRCMGHLEAKECDFYIKTINYLWLIGCSSRMETAWHTMDSIGGLKDKQNISKTNLCLRFCNLIKRVVPKLARISSPFKEKVRKCQPFNFKLNKKELAGKKRLQKMFAFPSALAYSYAEAQTTPNK